MQALAKADTHPAFSLRARRFVVSCPGTHYGVPGGAHLAEDTSDAEQGPLPAFSDLRGIRQLMGKSQSEMARLLDISTRAVQSYEQGWRGAPPSVQKNAMLQLYLQRRQQVGAARPCWQVCACSQEERAQCPAWLLQEGQLCWLTTGNRFRGMTGRPTWPAKAAHCQNCPAMRERLGL